MRDAIMEGVKEALRLGVLAIIPVLITGLNNGEIDWQLVATVGLIAILRFVDKTLHQLGKEKNNEMLIKGLTRF